VSEQNKDDIVEVPLTMMIGKEKRKIGTATYVRFNSESVHVTVTDPVAKIYLKKRLLDDISVDPQFKSHC
jgi:hypothetical protein